MTTPCSFLSVTSTEPKCTPSRQGTPSLGWLGDPESCPTFSHPTQAPCVLGSELQGPSGEPGSACGVGEAPSDAGLYQTMQDISTCTDSAEVTVETQKLSSKRDSWKVWLGGHPVTALLPHCPDRELTACSGASPGVRTLPPLMRNNPFYEFTEPCVSLYSGSGLSWMESMPGYPGPFEKKLFPYCKKIKWHVIIVKNLKTFFKCRKGKRITIMQWPLLTLVFFLPSVLLCNRLEIIS